MEKQSLRFCLKVLILVYNKGLKPKDVKCAEMVLEENKELAISKWNQYFGNSMTEEEEEV